MTRKENQRIEKLSARIMAIVEDSDSGEALVALTLAMSYLIYSTADTPEEGDTAVDAACKLIKSYSRVPGALEPQ